MKKILLYSGGMDSWLIDKIWKPDEKVYINLHTDYSNLEMEKIKESGEDVTVIDFPSLVQFENKENGVIPLRNLYLIMMVCNITDFDDVEICLGATDGDRVHDKTLPFKEKAEDLLNYLYAPQNCMPVTKHIKINFDYKDYSKADLLEEYLMRGGDIEEAMKRSFSCHHPNEDNEPCWKCKPCFRKWLAFKKFDYDFGKEIDTKMMNYLKNQLMPKIIDGVHGRGKEDLDAIFVYKKYCEADDG